MQDLKSGISHDTSVVEYDYNGATKYASCYTGMDKSFILAISADDGDVMSDSLKLILNVTAISVIIGLVAIAAVLLFIGKFISPITYVSAAVDELARLDFRVKDENKEARYVKLKDEIGNIMKWVMTLRGELTEVVTDLKMQSQSLFEQSDSLSESAANTMNNMKDMTKL